MADDQSAVLFPDDPAVPVRQRTWALAEGGFVVEVKRGPFMITDPFGDVKDGQVVLDVTGVPCGVGFMVDNKGNVTPNEDGRTEAFLPSEPAYHDRTNPPAMPTAAQTSAVTTSEPHEVTKAGAKQPEGKQDNRATGADNDKQKFVDKGAPVADAKPLPLP